MTPNAGPINGIQTWSTATSAPASATCRAARNHERGLMESISRGATGRSGDGGPSSYCVVPGKSASGYCREKVTAETSCPRAASARATDAWKWAMPPRYGHAGPIRAIRATRYARTPAGSGAASAGRISPVTS